MKRKRLKDSEIRAAVDKIRGRYGDYLVSFEKGRGPLDAFEDRYIEAMRARMDLELFLHAEMTVVEGLIKSEQERINKEQEKEAQAKKKRVESRSYADRVIAELKRRIAKYPPIEIHADASQELERLVGCMYTLEREVWPEVEKFMRKAYTSLVLSPRSRLEERIISLCRPAAGAVPPRLARYQTLFAWTPRNFSEIEKEEKKCLLEVAFFLNDLSEVMAEMKKSPNLESGEKEQVDKMAGYVHNLLEDFRLNDLKTLPR